jgi:Flp pilus assembly protein TadG
MTFPLPHTQLSSLRRAPRDERGVAMVEFALVLPVLALLLLGILDFGKAFNYWIDETHLASEAARYAAVDQNPGSPNSSLLAWVRAQADTAELKNGSASVPTPLRLCISFPNGTHNVGDPVRVEVTSQYQFMSIFGINVPQPINASSTMRLERVPTTYAGGDCS